MARTNETKMIEFTEGELSGQKAYVTFEDGGDYLRVTPVKGDPLCSIELSRKRGGFKELPSNVQSHRDAQGSSRGSGGLAGSASSGNDK